ncbi:MAG: rhodanese-like domain-containing protein [Cyclobacteriaceae bacterium]
MELTSKIKNKEATIIDVRTASEYQEGNSPGSIHIPLNEIPTRIDELRSMKKPLVLCCASGNRSGQAQQFLSQNGISDVYNGGSWMEIVQIQSN